MAVQITTHNGQFHADEVLAYTMLNTIFPINTLSRTRDKLIIDKSDIVVDVGMVYDPDNNKFDHHQENCKEIFPQSNIPMSSAGMVYLKYGKEYLKKITNNDVKDELYYDVYNNIIKEVDAIDNGVEQSKSLAYYINTNISKMIARFNGEDVYNNDEQMKRFINAHLFMKQTLEIIIMDLYSKQKLFDNEYTKMKKIMESSKTNYIVVDFDCINWYKCVDTYCKSNQKQHFDWIIYKDSSNWRIRTITKNSKKLHTEEYYKQHVTKPDEIIFVHKGLFIGCAKTLKTVLEMANL